MITGRGNTITIGKFTTRHVNMLIHAIHLVEIAFHSDFPGRIKHASSWQIVAAALQLRVASDGDRGTNTESLDGFARIRGEFARIRGRYTRVRGWIYASSRKSAT